MNITEEQTFAESLKKQRSRLGLTQPEAAAVIAIPLRTYCRYEKGAVEPPAALQEGALARLRKHKPAKKSER